MDALQVVTIILVICIILAILVLSSMVITNRHDELLTRASSLKQDIREYRKNRYLIGRKALAHDAELLSAISTYPTIKRERDEIQWERKWLPKIRRRIGTGDSKFTRNEDALSDAREELSYVESEIAKIEGSRLQMAMIDLFVKSTHGVRTVRDRSRQAQQSFDALQQSMRDANETRNAEALTQQPRQYGSRTYFANPTPTQKPKDATRQQNRQNVTVPRQGTKQAGRRNKRSGWSQTNGR